MNRYRNAHYFESNYAKIEFKRLVSEQVEQSIVYTRPITIHYTYYFARRGSDLNNVHSVISKFFPDALVEMGKIKDDTADEIVDSRETFGWYDKVNPRVEIEISYF